MKSRFQNRTQPGDPIRAEDWNRLVSRVNRLESGGHGSALRRIETGAGSIIASTMPKRSVVTRSILSVTNGGPGGNTITLPAWGPTWSNNTPPNAAMPSQQLDPLSGSILVCSTDRYETAVEGPKVLNPYPWPVTLRQNSVGRRFWVEKASGSDNWLIVSPYGDTFRTNLSCTGYNAPSGQLTWAINSELYNVGMFTVEDNPGGGSPKSYITSHCTAGIWCRVDVFMWRTFAGSFAAFYNGDAIAGEVDRFSGVTPATITHQYNGELFWSAGSERHFAILPVNGNIGDNELIITPLGFQTG